MNKNNIADVILIVKFMKRYSIVNLTAYINDNGFFFTKDELDYFTWEEEGKGGCAMSYDSIISLKDIYDKREDLSFP